jgi:hypothetical protein
MAGGSEATWPNATDLYRLPEKNTATEQMVDVAELHVRLAARERELSQQLSAQDRMAEEHALTRRNFEIAAHVLRVGNQIEDIVARTSVTKRRIVRRLAPRQVASRFRRIRKGVGTGSLLAMERLRRELARSPLFNAAWYLSQRPDLTEQDPVDHFIDYGINEGTSPHPLIDVDWIAKSSGHTRQDALQKYLVSGRYAALRPTAMFDVDHYRKAARIGASADALSHYLRYGQAAGLSPHPLFDPVFYRSQFPKYTSPDMDPLVHYVLYPLELDPHPLFSTEFYLRQHPELRTLGIPPLHHYLEHGLSERTSPHPSFSAHAYLNRHEDVAAAGLNPLLHYAIFGKAEGRQIQPVGLQLPHAGRAESSKGGERV